MLGELEQASATDWAMCKELYLGRLLVDAGVPDATLRRLADATRTCSRAEWVAAFGLALRRKDHWRSFELPSRVVELRRQVAAAGGCVAHLSTRQLLTLAQPVDTIGEGWGSALSYFAQNLLHFAEVYTDEGVAALAAYLATRQQELGSTRPVLEVGAGSGRLAFLLNATQLLSSPVIATEPLSDPASGGGEAHGASFPVAQLDAESALRTHDPAIVLCAFMDFGSDWTHVFRAAGVREYLLIGELGRRGAPKVLKTGKRLQVVGGDGQLHDLTQQAHAELMGSCCYSLSLPHATHAGYERRLLAEVSRELLHVKDAQDSWEEGGVNAEEGILAAVAFRRTGTL